MITTRTHVLLAVCGLLAAAQAQAHAQSPAQRPLRIVVAAAPGSPADEQIRALAPALSESLGRNVLLDNRGFDRGIPAAQSVARADADGSTLLLGSSATHASNPVLHERLPYDPLRDFVAVTQLSSTGIVVVGAPRLPGSAVESLARYAAQAGRLTLASGDAVEELAGRALGRRLGIELRTVRQASSIEAMAALRAGTVDLALRLPYAARPHVHAGRLKAFGITGSERSSALPEVATLGEQGIEGYDIPSWDGVFAPAGTPAAIVEAASRAVRQALGATAVRNLYRELGITPLGSPPASFAAVVKRDLAIFARFAAEGGSASR